MICADCAWATTETARGGYLNPHVAAGHERCQARTDAQREALPFALSGCACQHRPAARVAIPAPPRVGGLARAMNAIQSLFSGECELVMPRPALDYHYGPTADDPDPGKMWHYGCGQEVLFIEDGLICGCGAQGEE